MRPETIISTIAHVEAKGRLTLRFIAGPPKSLFECGVYGPRWTTVYYKRIRDWIAAKILRQASETPGTRTVERGTRLVVPESFSWDRELYSQLHALAVDRLGPGKSSTTLGATALLHEAYLRLAKAEALQVPRGELVAMASYAIRSALIDQARKKKAEKRGGYMSRCPADDSFYVYEQRAGDLLGLDEALNRLQKVEGRLADIVNLRFFGGLSEEEIAAVLDISSRTVRRDWQLARAWLRKELVSWTDG